MTKGTPQPTDKCECGKTYADHFRIPPSRVGWCTSVRGDLRKFTPIVPSPDSVKDMGENILNPSLSGTFTELCNLDPAAKAIKMHLENGADLHFLLISAVEYYAPIALKYSPATAARLEEVLAENERLKEINQHLENAYRQSYQDHGVDIDKLREAEAEVERYREALTKAASALKEMEVVIDTQHEAIVHFLGPQAPAEFSESKTKLHYVINEIESALRGATEQSTEQ